VFGVPVLAARGRDRVLIALIPVGFATPTLALSGAASLIVVGLAV